MRIRGSWADGYVLDYHTVTSKPTGDPYHPFETKRTELGQLLYQFKYGNGTGLTEIVDTVEDFIRNQWRPAPNFEYIVPAPASVTTRKSQPVVELARELAKRLGVTACEDAVMKVTATQQMKNIDDWHERQKALKEAIQKGSGNIAGKRILLVDDLTESGSTLGRVAEVLLKDGEAAAVYALALTRTK
jgi:predicted amidophosphoribosyltransferase